MGNFHAGDAARLILSAGPDTTGSINISIWSSFAGEVRHV